MEVYQPMDEKTKESVLKKIDKTLDELKKANLEIKSWLKTQNHLPEEPSDSLIDFIIVNADFDLELAKKRVNFYYSIRTEMPEIFEPSYPLSSEMIDTLNCTTMFPLPKYVNDSEGCIFVKLKNCPIPSGFEANFWISCTMNIFEVVAQESLLLNQNIIYDNENLSLGHAFYITPRFIMNCATLLEKLYGDRVKHIHFINYPSIMQLVLAVCKPILKPELFEKFKLHDSVESLAKYVPLDLLPKDYGGKEKSLEELEWAWKEKLCHCKERFDQLKTLKFDESKNPEEKTVGLLEGFSKLFF